VCDFNLDKTYTECLQGSFGSLTQAQVGELFRDGRMASSAVFMHLCNKHGFETVADPQLPDHNVKLSTGEILVVRMLNKKVLLNLMKHNGYGRGHDQDEYNRLRARIVGYIIVDMSKFPLITYAYVSKSDVAGAVELPYVKARQLIEKNVPWSA